MLRRWYIGLSAGSSLFGVDAALVRVDGQGTDLSFGLEQFLHVPHGPDLRELLWRVHATPTPELRHLGVLHRVLGETFALVVKQLLEQARLPAPQVTAIGCPGQELWHDPDGRYPAHLTLGMASVVAERTGLTTIADFSSRDLAVGGLGLPLTALVDARLFHHPSEHRVVLHLGSSATLISLPQVLGANWRNLIGFQATPCTLLLDGVMRQLTANREPFDAGGKHAVQGRCLEPLLERWMQDSYFQRRPPKCVSRIEFGGDFLVRAIEQAKRIQGNLRDVLCTLTHLIVRAIVQAIQKHLPTSPTRILLTGRGARNGFLWHLLEQQLPGLPIEKTDAHGIPMEARKALAYAGLAALTMDGVPINLPSVTGAAGPRLLGHFTPGSTANWARCLAWMARQTAPFQSAAA